MLETVVTKENGIRAAADGDVETLALFFRQFRDLSSDAKNDAPSESPERAATMPTVQWGELTTTFFREAIENGQLEVVRTLLDTHVVQAVYSARIEKQRLLSQLLAWATRDDYSEIVKCLLSHGADPNAPVAADDADAARGDEQEELPPLSLAARLGSLEIAELLLRTGASVNARDERDGATALHEAARQDEPEMIELLVQHGADINAADDLNRETPLHVATKKGNQAAVKMLLACRADTTRVNRHGSCVVHLARVEAHDVILHLLRDAGAHTETTPRK